MEPKNIPSLIDLSCVKAQSTFEEMNKMVSLAKRIPFACCFSMPYYTKWLVEQLKGTPGAVVGGAAGFPHGNELTELKVLGAKLQLAAGAREIDMVQNITALKHGDYEEVRRDIEMVREATRGNILKVILEVSYLSDYEICKAAEIAASAGADFVKTGTGWANQPTLVRHIALIRDVVGTSAGIKAAGGIRTLETMQEMIDAGCTRFGISVNSCISILREAGFDVE